MGRKAGAWARLAHLRPSPSLTRDSASQPDHHFRHGHARSLLPPPLLLLLPPLEAARAPPPPPPPPQTPRLRLPAHAAYSPRRPRPGAGRGPHPALPPPSVPPGPTRRPRRVPPPRGRARPAHRAAPPPPPPLAPRRRHRGPVRRHHLVLRRPSAPPRAARGPRGPVAAPRPGAHAVPVRGRERALAGPGGRRQGGRPHPAPGDGGHHRHGARRGGLRRRVVGRPRHRQWRHRRGARQGARRAREGVRHGCQRGGHRRCEAQRPEDKVEIRHGSWFEPLEDLKGKLMGVISNPPYIPTDDLPGLQPEVGWHEPKLALDGGKDGLEHLLHLCEGLSSVLKPGGFFVFETSSVL
uniref:Uncharacterized protein n=1 Tax=Zea mays TaxID=4577 RepID=A0A804LRT8_MAIZE